MFFRFFNRKPQQEFTVLARYRTGHWFKRFTVSAVTAYEACRKFDQSEDGLNWIRVSGATVTAL